MCRATTGDRPRKQSRLSQIHRSSSAAYPVADFEAMATRGVFLFSRRVLGRMGSSPDCLAATWCSDILDAIAKNSATDPPSRLWGGSSAVRAIAL